MNSFEFNIFSLGDTMELALKFINSLYYDKEFKKQLGLEKCIITNESRRDNIIFRSKEVKCYRICMTFDNVLSKNSFDHQIYINLNKCYKHNLEIVFRILNNLLDPYLIKKPLIRGNFNYQKKYIAYVELNDELISLNDYYFVKYKLNGFNDLFLKESFFITNYESIPYLKKIKHYNFYPYYFIPEENKSRVEGISKWTKDVIRRDGACVKCGSRHRLEAHHINGYADYPHGRVDVNNGATLCHKCHKKYHRKFGTKRVNRVDFHEFIDFH